MTLSHRAMVTMAWSIHAVFFSTTLSTTRPEATKLEGVTAPCNPGSLPACGDEGLKGPDGFGRHVFGSSSSLKHNHKSPDGLSQHIPGPCACWSRQEITRRLPLTHASHFSACGDHHLSGSTDSL